MSKEKKNALHGMPPLPFPIFALPTIVPILINVVLGIILVVAGVFAILLGGALVVFAAWLVLASLVIVFRELKQRPFVSFVTLLCVGAFLFLWQLAYSGIALAMKVIVPSLTLEPSKLVIAPTLPTFCLIAAELIGLLVASGLLTLYQKKIFKMAPTLRTVGLRLGSRWATQLAIGWGLSVLLIGSIFGGLWLGGWVKVSGISLVAQAGVPIALWLAGYIVLFGIIAFCEEVALRGFVLQNLAWYIGPMAAIFLSSVFTSLLHRANPSVNVIGFSAMFLSGVLFSYLYFATKSLWMPIGLHWGWNFFLGPVCGFTVSGFKMEGLLITDIVSENVILTGGAFGPEGGFIGVIAIIVLFTSLMILAAVKETRAKNTTAST